MKKIFNLNSYITLLAVGIILLIAAGCKKVNTSDVGTARLFKPGSLSVSAGQNSAKVTWTAPLFNTSGDKISYTAQFSQDTTFATVEFTLNSDTLGVTATDDKLAVRKNYYVRVKALATSTQPESKWIESAHFSISGTQLFQAVRELEIKETSVTLRFTPTTGLTKITMTPATGTAFDVALSGADAAAGIKVITGLTPGTKYTAELFDTKSKGFLTFTTLTVTVYTTTINPTDNLATTIANAATGAVIGLNPGTYSLTSAATSIIQKTITLKSTSGNPSDTKINFKEFTLRGTGAGINVSGIECDGTTGAAAYFVNCTGVAADAELCTYTQVTVDNCIVHGVTTSFLRANRGTAAGDYKMGAISVKNSVVYGIGALVNYACFHLDKLQFTSLTVTKSTFYDFGMELLLCSTVIPGGAPAPNITFDLCTFNNFGASSKNALVSAGANPITLAITNSIFGNIPRAGAAVPAAAIAATAGTNSITFSNNNLFKDLTGAGGTVLTLPTQATNNKAEDLGWTATTTDFTLAAGIDLRIFSTTGGAIGDPRWTY